MSRVLILRLSSLGDIVQVLPLAGVLEEAGHEVTWLLENRFAGLGTLLRGKTSTLVWERGWRGVVDLWGKGRDGFDLALDLQGNWKSAFLGKILGLKRVVGFPREELREPLAGVFKQERMGASSATHMAERAREIACFALDQALPPLPPPPHLLPSAGGEMRLKSSLLGTGLSLSSPFHVLVVGDPRDPRAWPLSHILELYSRLPVSGLVLLGPREKGLSLPPWVRCLRQDGFRGLEELVALGAHLHHTGGTAVGHDGGAMHILNAAGARTLFLFGPQDPLRTGPQGGVVLVGKDPLDCRPCRKRRCSLPEGPLCMEGIGVGDVLAQLDATRSPLS